MIVQLRLPQALVVLCLASWSSLGLPAQQTATIEVNAGRILGPVNRLVFGQNIAAADNARIFSSDKTDLNLIQNGEGIWDPSARMPVPLVVAESKAVGTAVLRYPGGCFAHNFDWRKTVGPDAKNTGWLFGLDEYMTLCQTIGATPLITVSDYVLPVEQMPENAAQLVEYLNSPADAAHPWAMKRRLWGHPAPYNVTWFELGNESDHGNHRVIPHRQYSAEQYAGYFNATAAAMRRVDPRIKLGIVLMPGPGTDIDCDWNHTVVRLAGAKADFAVVHMYAPQGSMNGVTESVRMQAMMVAPQHVEERLRDYHRMIEQQLGHDLPLAITEFNGVIDQPAYHLSYGGALESADLLRVFLKPDLNIALAAYWQFVNGPFQMLQTNLRSPNGEPASEEPLSLLYKIWAQHFGSKLVGLDVDSPRSNFIGAASEEADTGDSKSERRQIQLADLDQSRSLTGALWPRLLNVQIQAQKSDLTIHMDHLNRTIYPLLARIPRPAAAPADGIEFEVSFDAKFTPDPGSQTPGVGLGLIDSRGWSQSGHSGIAIDDISTNWTHLDRTYRLTPQTPAVDLSARLLADGMNASGTLEIHNLTITEFAAGHDAAYPLLTSAASISGDGTKAYLIVLNKSETDSISTTIHLEHFAAAEARYWEVNGPSLASATGVAQTHTGDDVPLSSATAATHVFPAHSMTAIEFSNGRQNVRQ